MKVIFRQILLAFIVVSGFSQKWEVGTGVGLMHYKGDLSPRLRPLDGRPGFNAFVRYNKRREISYSFHAEAGRLMANETKSSDRFQRLRGYSFKSNVAHVNAKVEYNFLNFRVSQANFISDWTPYTYIGLGTMYRQLKDFKANINTNPAPAQLNYGQKFAISVPIGVGFKKKWNGPWNYGAEFGSYKLLGLKSVLDASGKKLRKGSIMRYDFIDGLGPDAVNAADRLQTTNRDLGDWQLYTRFYVSYVFYKVACPKD